MQRYAGWRSFWSGPNHTVMSFLRNTIPVCLEERQAPRPRTTSLPWCCRISLSDCLKTYALAESFIYFKLRMHRSRLSRGSVQSGWRSHSAPQIFARSQGRSHPGHRMEEIHRERDKWRKEIGRKGKGKGRGKGQGSIPILFTSRFQPCP